MKKVLFLQNKGNDYGGVWQVNKLVGEELQKNNYVVSIVSIRNSKKNENVNKDTKLNTFIINEKDVWGTFQGREILSELKKKNMFNACKMLFLRIVYKIKLKIDKKELCKYIKSMNPNYIITSQYELLNMIPKKYLARTVHQQHSSFSDFSKHKATVKTMLKYNNKIGYLWLSKETMKKARELGLNNNYCIYNAARIESKKIANVLKNKKLVTIARLADQKDIGTMIDIVEEIFKDKKFDNWNLEIYGNGPKETEIRERINNSRIKMMGPTNDPKKVLLSSSINLNTSLFEGFSMSILEAQECGVPTISFNYWESVYEQILDNKTGIIVENKEEYINKLKELMLNEEKLLQLSKNAKEFSNEFHIDKIVDEWINMFDKIDKAVSYEKI